MKNGRSITVSAPGKINFLGEHVVVYGKPALLTTVNLRVTITLTPSDKPQGFSNPNLKGITQIIEPIVKKHLKIKTIPPYKLTISSELPIGTGLGSSAAISASFIAALLTFLRIAWDKTLVNELTFQAEQVFHGNPSGGDNSTVVFGGLIWFRKESSDLKLIQPLLFTIPSKIAKNFTLINTGAPKESTKEMIELVSKKLKGKNKKILDDQELLVKDLLIALKEKSETQLIQIIKAGEKNLEIMGAVSPFVKSIIRKIETAGGAAKVCGGGGKTKATGVLLCYHPNPSVISNIAKSNHLDYFKTTLGVEGLKQE